MLGILLLGTEILLLSAMWADSSILEGENCSELLENRGNETVALHGSESSHWYGHIRYGSRGYEMNVTFDLGTVPAGISGYHDIYYTGPVCFSVEEVWIQSTRRGGEEGQALVKLLTDAGILVGAVSGSLLYCLRHECILHSLPGFMETAPLKYSPLIQEFWTTFNDNQTFNKNWIRGIKMHTIEGNIPNQWVSRLSSSSLQIMHISGNDWRRTETPLLGYLPSLWFLNFTDNNIEVLHNGAFDGTPRLKHLILSGNKLIQLPGGLENNREFLAFHLENQRGRSVFQISDHTLPSLKKIYIIALWNVTVRVDLCNVSELVNLRSIVVINSEILSEKEEMHCTDSSQDIASLTLSWNNLTVLPSNLIKRMINLRSLIVPGNHLTDCPRNVLGMLRNLEALWLGSNRLRKLTSDCFHGLKRLRYLTLSENEIVSIEEGTFASLLLLRLLDLSRNNLVSIEDGTFYGLRGLRELYLSRNNLVSIEEGTFYGLRGLRKLDLSRNNLVSIEEGTFYGLRVLRELDLSRNKLVTIKGSSFCGLTSLQNLDLSSNKLTTIHYSAFLGVDTEKSLGLLYMKKIDLSFNRLNKVTLRAQSMPFIDELDLSQNFIIKIEVKRVEILNLSYNSLERIPDELVTISDGIKSVDVGGNNIACCHPNNVMLTNSTVSIYNLGTREPLYCYLKGQKITSQRILLNTSFCDEQESGSTVSVELWVSLGVFTAVAAVFMSFVYYYRTELAYLSLFAKILKRGIRTDEQKYNDAAYDAFVCYCGKNLAWIIKHLLHSVEGTDEGYRLCIHDRDFTLGAAIDTNVLTALDKSRKVIFVLSPAFMSSKWCRWELEMATHKMFEEERHYIILIELESLEGVVLAKQLKHLMKTRTYLHWPGDSATEDDTAKFWGRLRRALGQSLLCKTGRKLPQMTVLDIEE